MYRALSKAALERLLASLGDGAWLFDVEANRLCSSGTLLAELGYGDAELPTSVGELIDLIHPDDRATAREAIHSLAEGRQHRCDVKFRLAAKGDQWRWLRLQGSVAFQEEESRSRIVLGIATDITDQKLRQAEAEEAEELTRLAQLSAGAGTWDIDLVTGKLRLCASSLRMHNLPADHPMPITQQQWQAALEPQTAEVALRKFREAIASGENYSAEYQIKGTNRWVLGTGRAVRNAQGVATRFTGLNQDITDLKASKMMIAQMQNQLVHLARVSAMGTMAATIAHELNQPLAAISMYSAAARRKYAGENAELAAVMDHISAASERAGAVIRQMRAAIRKRDPEPQQVELETVVNAALELALLDARQEGVQVELSMPCGLTIEGDPIQLEQVVLNLVRNAVEAMEGCSVKRLSISGLRADKFIEIRISDTGCGFGDRSLETVFEPFVTSKPSGMGIGLSISRTIVEAHGGKLWARANPDAGATFCIGLPVSQSAAQEQLQRMTA